MEEIQSILFDRRKFTVNSATRWLGKHNYIPIKAPHITSRYIRFRLSKPIKNANYRTINLSRDVRAVVGSSNRVGGALDPVDLFANMVLPALMYGGISYGIYRAVKK